MSRQNYLSDSRSKFLRKRCCTIKGELIFSYHLIVTDWRTGAAIAVAYSTRIELSSSIRYVSTILTGVFTVTDAALVKHSADACFSDARIERDCL